MIENPRPGYRQVAEEIRRRIRNGVYPPASVLPAEPDLAEEIGVSRSLVNRALSALRSEGWVSPQAGRGTTVNPLPVLRRATIGRQAKTAREAGAARGAFAGEVTRAGFEPRSDVTVREATADEELAEELGVDPGTPVVVRERVMAADDIPVQFATSYLPKNIVAGSPIEQKDTGPGGTYSRLADIGYPIAGFRERVRVRVPNADEARILRLDSDHRVYAITRIARARDRETGPVVEVNRMVLPAHAWELETEWPAES